MEIESAGIYTIEWESHHLRGDEMVEREIATDQSFAAPVNGTCP